MKDTTFDYLTKRLKREWKNTDHPHKALITHSHLNAATGYDIQYPTIVKYAALEYLRYPNENN